MLLWVLLVNPAEYKNENADIFFYFSKPNGHQDIHYLRWGRTVHNENNQFHIYFWIPSNNKIWIFRDPLSFQKSSTSHCLPLGHRKKMYAFLLQKLILPYVGRYLGIKDFKKGENDRVTAGLQKSLVAENFLKITKSQPYFEIKT